MCVTSSVGNDLFYCKMIQYVLERFFDYMFHYLVSNLVSNSGAGDQPISATDLSFQTTTDAEPSRKTVHDNTLPVVSRPAGDNDKSYHIQVCYMDQVQKRMVNYNMTVKRSMKVEDVKKELYGQLNDNVEHWFNLAILFMGKELSNNLEISGCDLGDYSTLHALDSAKVKRNKSAAAGGDDDTTRVDPPLSNLPTKLTTIEEPDTSSRKIASTSTSSTTIPSAAQQKLYFFVYCQSCNAMRAGKLRVVCRQCELGSILFKHEPQDWNDVLIADSIKCKCYTPGCSGDKARFFFKCIDESQHLQPKSASSVTPLNRLRRNNIHISCLACMDSQVELMLVFPCDHVICIECFRDYCKTALSERNLSWIDTLGYTVNCPIDCDNSWIEPSHLNLLDDHYYSLYSKFSSEELVLKNGGILCPYSDCDQAYYPPTMPPTSCEVNECAKCKLVYCILCTYEGQYAPVSCPFESLIEQTNAEIRKNAIEPKETAACSTYLSSLVKKFNLLRMASSLTGSDARQEAPRWQDTMSRLKIREIAKPCPKCRTPTERNGGCMHMVCTRKRCNYNWCWICLTEWNTDCMSTHWFG